MKSWPKGGWVFDPSAKIVGDPRAGHRRALLLACVTAFVSAPIARAEPSFYTARVAPIFEKHCTVCHGPEKQKAKLRLDSFDHAMRGAESGAVIKPGDAKTSELFRRITLKKDDEDVMPSDGKPLLAPEEIKILELWIAAEASATKPLADFPTAPVPKVVWPPALPLVADWHPHAAEIAAFEKETGLRLLPRSQIATDGLVLRTASAPTRCDDAALKKLAPLTALIVEAELARTKISDAALKTIARWENLRALDLTRTAVSSAGLAAIASLQKLEALNLTETAIDEAGVAQLKTMPALKRVWLFGTKVTEVETPSAKSATK